MQIPKSVVALVGIVHSGRAFQTATLSSMGGGVSRRAAAPVAATQRQAETTAVVETSKTSLELESYQVVAGEVASSFEPLSFNPVPWLSNCHIQTIGAFFVRDKPQCAHVKNIGSLIAALVAPSPPSSSDFWDRRERIETPDKDWFHVDYKFVKNDNSNDEEEDRQFSRGTMIILHGLQSNSESSLSIDMAKAFLEIGLDVACINFRGCSGTPNDTIGGYHLGFTDDLLLFLEQNSGVLQGPVYLSGFSLGANVVVKALGELQERAVEQYNIAGAAAFCITLDAERNAPYLGRQGINRWVYTNNLLQSLKKVCQDKQERFANDANDEFDYDRAMASETITDFDDAFVAPIYGFDDAIDYYRQTSSAYFLERVAVPTLILNARDDPFLDPTYFPDELTREHGGLAPVKMVRTEHGGHLGFVFHQPPTGEEQPSTSWGPHEMARFIQHVHDKKTSSEPTETQQRIDRATRKER